MAFDSFRGFLQALEGAGELQRISVPVTTELEITELADREMMKPGGGKALLIEKPTVHGAGSLFPVAINTLGSHQAAGRSLQETMASSHPDGSSRAKENRFPVRSKSTMIPSINSQPSTLSQLARPLIKMDLAVKAKVNALFSEA